MNTFPSAKSLSVSVRVYRTLLGAYPKKFREHYETQMVQVFRDSVREADQHNGMPGVLDLWLHTLVDLVFTAFVERVTEGSRSMFSPKVILWGGLAAAIGGVFWIMIVIAIVIAPDSGGTAGLLLAFVLGLGGLAGLYSLQARHDGRLGLAGFLLGILGTVLALAFVLWDSISSSALPATIRTQPVLAALPLLMLSLALTTLGIGLALLGIASSRAKSLPRWPRLPLGLGLVNITQGITFWLVFGLPLSQGQNPWAQWPPKYYAFPIVEFVLLGLGWMALGILLMIEADARVTQSPPSTA